MPRAGLDEMAVLEAAAELADAHGLEGVSLALLAKKLGIRSPSLYNHINGLPELRRKLALFSLEMLYGQMTAVAGQDRGEVTLFRVVEAYLEFARTHPGLYESMQRAPESSDGEMHLASERVVTLMLELVQQLGLSGEAAIHAVRGLRSILHGFADLSGVGGFGMPYSIEQSLQFTLHSFIRGIAPEAKNNPRQN